MRPSRPSARRAAAVALLGLALALLASSCGRRAEVLATPDPDRAAHPRVSLPGGGSLPGATCSADTDCASGLCGGGYCCAGPCQDQCDAACVFYAYDGMCGPSGACIPTFVHPDTTWCAYCGITGGPETDLNPCAAPSCSIICDPHEGAPCIPDNVFIPPGLAPGVCQSGYCVLVPQPNGTPCEGFFAGICQSGFCVDNVCCDSACNGPCEGCSKAWGAPADGVCSPSTIPAGCGPDAGTDGGTGGSGAGGASTAATSGTGGAATSSSSGAGTGPTGASSAGSSGGGTCAHSPCTVGNALAFGCDKCATDVCAIRPFCCSGSWDAVCVNEAFSACGTCSGSSGSAATAAGSSGAGGAATAGSGTATVAGSGTTGVGTGSGTGSAGMSGGAGSAAKKGACATAPGPGDGGPWLGLLLVLLRRRRRAVA